MIRSYRAELVKLRRPATVAGIAIVAALGVLATVLVFALAKNGTTGRPSDANGFTRSLAALARPGGLTAGFVGSMTFVGLLMLVVLAVNVTSEYGLGTVRAMLIAQPRRGSWLAGKTAALLTAVLAATAAALVASVAAAFVMAAIRGVDTSAWLTADALGTGARDVVNAVLGVSFFGVAGIALAVLVRSTATALAIAVAWTFPLEHIIQNAWPAATHVFPGLAFNAVALGGLPDARYGTALAVALAYLAGALIVSIASFRRRDVTA